MAEDKYLTQQMKNGNVNISEEVVATVAALAAQEVDGVFGLTTRSGKESKEKRASRNLDKGITLSVQGERVEIHCDIVAYYGYPLLEVAKKVQSRISSTVESSTGIHVDAVCVRIVGVAVQKKAEQTH